MSETQLCALGEDYDSNSPVPYLICAPALWSLALKIESQRVSSAYKMVVRNTSHHQQLELNHLYACSTCHSQLSSVYRHENEDFPDLR